VIVHYASPRTIGLVLLALYGTLDTGGGGRVPLVVIPEGSTRRRGSRGHGSVGGASAIPEGGSNDFTSTTTTSTAAAAATSTTASTSRAQDGVYYKTPFWPRRVVAKFFRLFRGAVRRFGAAVNALALALGQGEAEKLRQRREMSVVVWRCVGQGVRGAANLIDPPVLRVE